MGRKQKEMFAVSASIDGDIKLLDIPAMEYMEVELLSMML